MGRRTRKRVVGGAAPPRASVAVGPRARASGLPARDAAPASPHARTPDRRARAAEAPRAPWAPLPLVEAAVLVGIACIVIGFARGADAGPWLIGGGFTLVCLAALELAVREHLAGFRSHSVLLAGALAVAVAAPAFLLTGLPQEAILVGAAAVGGVGVAALRGVFRRRSGGLGFRA